VFPEGKCFQIKNNVNELSLLQLYALFPRFEDLRCKKIVLTYLEDSGYIFGFGANNITLCDRSDVEHFAENISNNLLKVGLLYKPGNTGKLTEWLSTVDLLIKVASFVKKGNISHFKRLKRS
jgi:hypothetical protein